MSNKRKKHSAKETDLECKKQERKTKNEKVLHLEKTLKKEKKILIH